jgi:hypothetical protein
LERFYAGAKFKKLEKYKKLSTGDDFGHAGAPWILFFMEGAVENKIFQPVVRLSSQGVF